MRSWRLAALLVAAFALRLGFGLCSPFWMDDERQIYLIGLQYFTTGEWPYLGPDVVYTQSQVPGALQGILIAWPFRVVEAPESPFVLLNLLSFGALSLLAWYIGRRVPDVPRRLLWPLILFSPWTLNFSTHVTNVSYVLVGGVLFFVAIFELLPRLRADLVPRRVAFFMAGFGLLWVAQIHMSTPLLVPFALAALGSAATGGWRRGVEAAAWFSGGALIAGSTLVPTLVALGPAAGGVGANITFDPSGFSRLPEIAARFFSFASFELPRFLGPNTEVRLAFLHAHLWAAPFAVFAGVVGLLQPFVLLAMFFVRRGQPSGFAAVKAMTGVTLALLYLSFLFSVKDPASHTFYVTLPVVTIYAFYCWRPFLLHRAGRAAAVALLVSGFVTHLAIAIDGFHRRSLYRDRALVVGALHDRDYRILGERRPVLWEQERRDRKGQ
jgi:hypothetical protein